MSNLSYMQKASDRGQLQIHVTTERGFFPIKDASIRLSYTGNPTEIIEELSTDISGQTAAVELPAPPLEYSMEPKCPDGNCHHRKSTGTKYCYNSQHSLWEFSAENPRG